MVALVRLPDAAPAVEVVVVQVVAVVLAVAVAALVAAVVVLAVLVDAAKADVDVVANFLKSPKRAT